MSAFLEAQIINYIKGIDFPAAPVSLTLALSSTAIEDDGTGLTEPGGNYIRQPVTFGAPSIYPSGVLSISEDAILFPVATVSYGSITHVAVFSGTDLLFSGALLAVKSIAIGDTFSVAAGNIQFNILSSISVFLADIIHNWIRGIEAPVGVAAKIALSGGDILSSGSGMMEPNGAQGYARQDITFGPPSSTIGVGTTISNDNPIIFGIATNTNWPLMTHAGVYQAGSNNLLFFSSLAAPRTCAVGDSLPFPIGAVTCLVR